jgi:hypothetical protein
MRPEEIQQLLGRQPFQPFRIRLSHGATYEVRHPELAVVGRSSVFIGIPGPDSQQGIYENSALVALVHIAEIHPVGASTPPES